MAVTWAAEPWATGFASTARLVVVPARVTVPEEHRPLLRRAFDDHEGPDVDTQADASFAVFPTALHAVAAAVDAQLALTVHPWPYEARVQMRMGIYTGELAPSGVMGPGDVVGEMAVLVPRHEGPTANQLLKRLEADGVVWLVGGSGRAARPRGAAATTRLSGAGPPQDVACPGFPGR